MSFELPVATDWDRQDDENTERLLDDLDRMLVRSDGRMSTTGALILETLAEVCNPLLTPDTNRGKFWLPYRGGEKTLSGFFAERPRLLAKKIEQQHEQYAGDAQTPDHDRQTDPQPLQR